jgi:hypothetical protein
MKRGIEKQRDFMIDEGDLHPLPNEGEDRGEGVVAAISAL